MTLIFWGEKIVLDSKRAEFHPIRFKSQIRDIYTENFGSLVGIRFGSALLIRFRFRSIRFGFVVKHYCISNLL